MTTRDDYQDLISGINALTNMTQQQQLEYHKKHIQVLWRHVERLEKMIQAIPEGIRIKSGFSEVLVLKNGGIIFDGQRILLKTPDKQIGLPV